MTLDLTKPLCIEGVGPVRLLTSEGRSPGSPIVVEREDGLVWAFGLDGICGNYRLINAPEPPLVRWMVVLSSNESTLTFQHEQHALDDMANHSGSRLFRIEIPAEGQPKIEEVK